jgi:hypothetical protein
MKQRKYILASLIALSLLAWNTSYAAPEDGDVAHDHSAHSDETHAVVETKDDHSDHDHDAHEGHDHGEAKAGPNGGRVITSVEPHFEFFVTKERFIQITFLDDSGKPISPEKQALSLIGGDRQNPVRLRFEKKRTTLLSNQVIPAGNDLPVILSIKMNAQSKTIREKFNLSLSQCPTCDYKEYACICEHGEDSHEGHDH